MIDISTSVLMKVDNLRGEGKQALVKRLLCTVCYGVWLVLHHPASMGAAAHAATA